MPAHAEPGDPIYLDYAATAPLRPEVWEAMETAVESAYNPASSHRPGRDARRCLEAARAELSDRLGCRPGEITFTAGGTGSNNLAILGFARAHRGREPRVVISVVEHKSVALAAKRAELEGATVLTIPVDSTGTVRPEALEERLDDGAPTLVSVMWANNEVGAVQPVERLAELAHERGALFHTDAVQAVGKLDVSLRRVPADLMTITAHKLGGPVGIGLLVRREDAPLEPITYGGMQEGGLWPGTQNPVAATGFATAVRLAFEERPLRATKWAKLRDRLADRLRRAIPELRIHAEGATRLPNLLSVGVPGCDTGALLVALEMEGIAISAGSACDSGAATGSDVLRAMGVDPDGPYATLRFSLGHATTSEQVERAAEATARVAGRITAAHPA